MPVNAAESVAANLLLRAGLPFLLAYHTLRPRRDVKEIPRRAGLQLHSVRYVGYGLMLALAPSEVLLFRRLG